MPILDLDLARLQVESFRNRFREPTYAFACHAALPLVLTPDLLYHLWQSFDRDIYGRLLQVPWVAVADLALSDLCAEVSSEVYEMKTPVRRVLLDALKLDPRFGETRLHELADFIQEYINEELTGADARTRTLAQLQKWTALAVAEPAQAATQVASEFKTSILDNKVEEQLRLASVVDTLGQELIAYPELLTYVSDRRALLLHKPASGTRASTPSVIGEIELPPLDTNLPSPVERQPAPLPLIPPYIFGMNDRGGESELLSANKQGWIVVTLDVNHSGGTPDDFTDLSSRGLGVIVILVNGFGENSSFPPPAHFDAFAVKCADFVRRSTGARIWVIGDAPNLWAGTNPNIVFPADVSNANIAPQPYARVFNKCRQAIRTLPGHENDWVLPAAVSALPSGTAYPGNPTGDSRQHLSDMLSEILAQGGAVDGIALQTSSVDSTAGAVQSEEKWEEYPTRRKQFRAYRDFMEAIPPRLRNLPVLVTSATATYTDWADENTGWIQAAYAEIDGWNQDAAHQPIQALCLYRWRQTGSLGSTNIQGKPRLIQDLRAALQNDYVVRMPGAAPAIDILFMNLAREIDRALQAEDFARANETWRQLEQARPQHPRTSELRVKIYREQQVAQWYSAARAARAEGRSEIALELLQRIQETHPDYRKSGELVDEIRAEMEAQEPPQRVVTEPISSKEVFQYLDFDLAIERTNEGYLARVINSPAGEARISFRLPFSDLEIENLLLRIGQRRGVR